MVIDLFAIAPPLHYPKLPLSILIASKSNIDYYSGQECIPFKQPKYL